MVLLNLVEASVAVALIILFTILGKWSLWFASFVAFFWGIQDSGVNCYLNALLGFQFESKTLPFSVYKCVQSLFAFVFIFIASFLKKKQDYIFYFAAIYVLGVISRLLVMLTFDF